MQMERNQNQNELEKAAFALEQDEISGIVEENGAFYILKCTNAYDQAATAARKKKLAQEKKNNAFQKIYAPFATAMWWCSTRKCGRRSTLRAEKGPPLPIFLNCITVIFRNNFRAIKNSIGLRLYDRVYVKTTRPERLMNGAFTGSFQLVLYRV